MSDLSEKASSDVGGEAPRSASPVVKRNPFRSTFFNITILGIACFLSPGLWGATAALGAGGTQSPQLVNASNSATFSLMVVTGLLTPALVRLTSIRTVSIRAILCRRRNAADQAGFSSRSLVGAHYRHHRLRTLRSNVV